MCTICFKSEFQRKTAETDIPCYKVMKLNNMKYYTPYYDMEMEIGTRYDNNEGEYINEKYQLYETWGCFLQDVYEFRGGFFHSFINYSSALHLTCLLNMPKVKNIDYHIIKCIIPSGSEYIKGISSDNYHPTYVSKSIILKEKVFSGL